MRTIGIGLAVLLGGIGTALGQGWGGGGFLGGRSSGESSASAAMETTKGKIILLNSNHLFKIDKKTMKIEASVSLRKLLEEAREKDKKEDDVPLPQWLQRFDINGDGKIAREELDNPDATWRWIGRFDKNEDGTISGAEANSAVTQVRNTTVASRKPAIIKVDGDDVLVLAQDRLFKFALSDLSPRKSVDVTDPDVKDSRAERTKRDGEAAKLRKEDPEAWRKRFGGRDRGGRNRGNRPAPAPKGAPQEF